MKEFMLYIRNQKDAKNSLSPEKHLEFIQKCETYIGVLKKENKLIAAQPLIREGVILKKSGNNWIEDKLAGNNNDVQVGYYHIVASDIDEAIKIAKDNPEFEYVASATIEVRPVKVKENETGFTYPSNEKSV